jgi:sRNA-binding carbon storage regulator CsrA
MGALIISRREGESVLLRPEGDPLKEIRITVMRVNRGVETGLRIDADRNVDIIREEIEYKWRRPC